MKAGVRSRLLLVALTAPLVVLIALLAYVIPARVQQLETALVQHAHAVAMSLAGAARESLVAGDVDGLRELGLTALQLPSVATISFSSADGDVLLSLDEQAEAAPPAVSTRLLRLFLDPALPLYSRAPVYVSDTAAGMALAAGAVTLEVSVDALARREAKLWSGILLIVLLSGALGVALALYQTSNRRQGARALIDTIRQFERGHLETRVRGSYGDELGELADALNHMGRALRLGQLELQRKVDQITGELRQTLEAVEIQNVELDLARKRALEASKVKSEFLANMSHEIRTPINGILGFGDLLSHTELDDEQQDYVNTVKESCASLLAIVNDILDFSRIEAGKMVIDNVAFDLRDCVEEVLALLAPTAYGKSLELVQLIYRDVPLKLYGDPIRIRQVLTNLAHNAIKFTPSGRVVVRVMMEDETDQEVVLRINVTDTGIGLSQSDQEKLFRAFGQADTSITRRFGGAGLGLIISRKLVDQMGGTMGLESEPGKGSTFWFTLRCIKQRTVDGQEPRDTGLAGYRVLVYDAEPLSRLALKHTLEGWGTKVIEVEERQSFIAQASAESTWDVALVALSRADLNARVFHGLMPRLRHVSGPIVALASTTDRNELRGLYQQGARVTLPKAVRRQTLYRELCRLLLREQPTAVATKPGAKPALPAPRRETMQRPAEQLSVLVVDDNHINRKLVSTILGNYGVTALEAEDGRQAVDIARARHLDLIFMDIQMPTMSGETAALEIQAQQGKGEPPVIVALTANAMPGERERLLAAGMDDCLIKPITEDQVAGILRSLNAKLADEPAAEPGVAAEKRPIAEELRALLAAELPDHKRGIQKAFRGNQLKTLKDRVHTLHGAASVCQLPALKAACADLENALMRDDLVPVPGGVKRLLAAIDALLENSAATS